MLALGLLLLSVAGCAPKTGSAAFAGEWAASSGMYVDSGEVAVLADKDLVDTRLYVDEDGELTLEFLGRKYCGTYVLYDEADKKYDFTLEGEETVAGSFGYISETDSIALTLMPADVGAADLIFWRVKK